MKLLSELLSQVKTLEIIGNTAIEINEIQIDSRKIVLNDVFVALRGTQVDGHTFIKSVIEKGASVIVCEEIPENLVIEPQSKLVFIKVVDTSIALGKMATNFYENPSHQLKIVAITGTNGKTTNVTLLYKLFRRFGHKVGMLSTVQNLINDEIIPSTHTTPDALAINHLMAKMVEKGCEYCFMEASSHAIHQNRMAGLSITGAVFTNITHDHLDYHQTFDNYIKAKKKLFDELPSSAFALSNIDDKRGAVMLQNTQATKHTFALKQMAEFKARLIGNTLQGLEMEIDQQTVWFRLIGEFNAYNLLGVYAIALLLGKEKLEVLAHLSAISSAKGRFEQVISPKGVIGIIDYAHTPDALENVLETIDQLRTRNEKVISVFGCGGNRDKTKRPIMANIGCKYSDLVILTSDNPRYELAETILEEMESGISGADFKKYIKIVDRHGAIAKAVELAQKNDIILIAGKGHEDYQEINGVKHYFDDRVELEKLFMLA